MSTETEHSDIGHAGLEQRLRHELDQVTVQVPADMITRAHHAYRKRLVTTRVSVISGTAAVIAIAATTVAMTARSPSAAAGSQRPGPVTSGSHSPGVPASASVPAASLPPPPPGDGLSAQQAAGYISWTRTLSTPAGGATTVSDQFTYGSTARDIHYAAGGRPSADDQVTTVTGAHGTHQVTSTHVSYQHHAWSRSTVTHPAGRSSHRSLCLLAQDYGVGLISASVLISSAGSLLACRGLTVSKGVRIDGINAVTISTDVLGTHDTLWLNAVTDVPIQTTAIPDHPRSSGTSATEVQFGFLPPTPANLAYLSSYIPPGFEKVAQPAAGAS